MQRERTQSNQRNVMLKSPKELMKLFMKENGIVKIYEGSRSEQELNWWLSIIAAHDAELVKWIKERKKPWKPGDKTMTRYPRGYNDALDAIINKVSNTEK